MEISSRIFRLIFWLFAGSVKKRVGVKEGEFLIQDVAVVKIDGEGKHTPHFGFIYDLSKEEAEKLSVIGIFVLATLPLGEHINEQEWTRVFWGEKTLLLIPKRYIIFTVVALSFFVRLAPQRQSCRSMT